MTTSSPGRPRTAEPLGARPAAAQGRRTDAAAVAGDRGSVTAELALAFPGVVLALLAAVAAGQVVLAQVSCTDAARAGAREAARGDPSAQVVRQAGQLGPPGATVTVTGGAGTVTVDVTAPVRLPLPGGPVVTVHGRAVGPVEQPS